MLLRRALYGSQVSKAAEGTALSSDCIQNLRVGFAHMLVLLFGELTWHNSAPAQWLFPIGKWGRDTRLSLPGLRNSCVAHSMAVTKQMKSWVASCLYKFFETLKFSILILFISSSFFSFNGQEKFPSSFYLLSQWLYGICLEPIWLFSSTSRELVLTSEIRF